MRDSKKTIISLMMILGMFILSACSGNQSEGNTNLINPQNAEGNGENNDLGHVNDWDTYSADFVSVDDWVFLSGISMEGRQYSPEITDAGLRIDLSNTFGWFRAHQQFLTEDSIIEMEVVEESGSIPAIEIYCRSNEPGEYRFFIYYGGFWDIGLFDYYTAEYRSLSTGNLDSLNTVGKTNTYKATCVGDLLTLSINGKLVGEVLDTTYTTGIVGFGVQNVDPENTVLIINSFQVRSTYLDK